MDESPNIYKNARRASGLTQERWAELLGISAEAVRQYETDRILPSDTIVLRMAEAAGQTIVCYWHMLNKSRVAAELLPEVEEVPLPQAVLQLLRRMRDFDKRHRLDDLLTIAEDGVVDDTERPDFDAIVSELMDLFGAAMSVKFSQGAGKEKAGGSRQEQGG